jgi:hypothetical protein
MLCLYQRIFFPPISFPRHLQKLTFSIATYECIPCTNYSMCLLPSILSHSVEYIFFVTAILKLLIFNEYVRNIFRGY